MAFLNLGEHCLVDVEGLVDDLDALSGLLLIPLLKLGDHGLVNVAGPVVDLEDLGTVLGAGDEHKGCEGPV